MKALIAMSGGVDSSVAAKLMCDQGYECIGCTMKLYDNDDADIPKDHTCCSLDDVEDARSVAYRLGMPYYVFNFKDEFRSKVIDKFCSSYLCARTPNPCIDCNRFMKFDKLHLRARELGCDYVVTGHYAIIEKRGEEYILKKALDPSKDQSYVLYSLTQEQLAHTLFPLGAMPKSETRKIAQENDFINASKPDSQDICFVPNKDYAAVVEKYTGNKFLEGNFVDKNGKVLGKHKGIANYTLGQHKGLGLYYHETLYVIKIDHIRNEVVLGKSEDLFTTTFTASNFNWISGKIPSGQITCKAKVRYRQTEQDAVVEPMGDNRVKVVFCEPQRAITPGQAVVLYDGDIVLGGGEIDS